MKKSIFISSAIFAYCILHTLCCFPQGAAINTTGNAADSSAILDISSTSMGLRIPRVALTGTTDVTTIPNPAVSLLVYDSLAQGDITTPGFYYWDGAAWVMLNTGSGGGASPSCPSGSWSSVNTKYCIENDENTAGAKSLFEANVICASVNAHVCSWSEWNSACSLLPGLLNMTDDWEWIDDANSYGTGMRATYVGNGGCNVYNSNNPSSSFAFRCCYTK